MLNDAELRSLLESSRTIAIVGAKDTPGQPVDRVGRYLIAAGYEVMPVHPARKKVWNLDCFARLADIPVPIDIIDVFRAPQFCPGHAAEAVSLATPPRLFWMQLGIRSEESVAVLEDRKIPVVEDACLMVEHIRLFG